MKTGIQVEGKWYSWQEIYKLCGCVHEDFLYDSTCTGYNDLLEAIAKKEKQND